MIDLSRLITLTCNGLFTATATLFALLLLTTVFAVVLLCIALSTLTAPLVEDPHPAFGVNTALG